MILDGEASYLPHRSEISHGNENIFHALVRDPIDMHPHAWPRTVNPPDLQGVSGTATGKEQSGGLAHVWHLPCFRVPCNHRSKCAFVQRSHHRCAALWAW